MTVSYRAIYTRRVKIYYGIWWLKKELSVVHGTLQMFTGNYTNSSVNTDSFYANFTNTTFQKEPPFLTLHEFKVNSFTNTDFFLGTKLFCLSRQIPKTLSIFMIQDFVKPHKISAFYLDKQKSFVPKKRSVLLVKELVLTKLGFQLARYLSCHPCRPSM